MHRNQRQDLGVPEVEDRGATSRTGSTRAGETLEALSLMAAFVGFALAWAAVEGGAAHARTPYLAGPMEESSRQDALGSAAVADEPPRSWLVDGFNVLNVGLLHGAEREAWWGPQARARLVELACRFDDPRAQVWLVFDGRRPADSEPPSTDGRVQVRFEPSADDWLLARVRSASDPGRVALVTADRKLADRARHRGAEIVSPHAFLARCKRSAQ